MDLISIILAAYNCASTLERAVRSVQAQTYSHWELVIVDDASTDATWDLVSAMANEDPRIRPFRAEQNRGPSFARNTGLTHAAGQWIAVLDSDDAMLPSRLQTLHAASGGYDLIADIMIGYDATAQQVSGPLTSPYPDQVLSLTTILESRLRYGGVDYGYLKPLMRSTFLREQGICYDNAVRQGEDTLLYVESLCRGARFGLLNEQGYLYTTPVGALSGNVSPHSHTIPNARALAEGFRQVQLRCRELSSSDDALRMKQIIRHLDRAAPWWEYEDLKRRRRVWAALRLLMTSPSVQVQFIKSTLRTLASTSSGKPSTKP